jgi:4-amino-4-deoxy-L-arabinose transferase-like glycosyltransferase
MKRRLQSMSPTTQALGLFLLALTVRLAFVLTLENRLYWPDEVEFDQIAMSLVSGKGYQSDPFRGNPILPLVLAGFYKIFGHSYIAPRIFQSVIGALTVVVMFMLARRLCGSRVAFLAGLGLALYPSLVYTSGVFYVDCLFTFLIALTVYLLSLSAQYDGARRHALVGLSGVMLGITVLCRPIFLAYLPFAVLVVLFTHDENLKGRIGHAILLSSMALLAIIPWTVRNYMLYDRALLVSTGGGLFLWRGNNELTQGDTHDRYLDPGVGEVWSARLQKLEPAPKADLTQKYDAVGRDLQALDSIGKDTYLGKLALSFMIEHPVHSFVLFMQKLRTLYTPFTEVRPRHRNIFTDMQRHAFGLIFGTTLVFGLIGFLHGLSNWRAHLPLYLAVLSVSLAYGLTTAAARFRIPIEPFLILCAAQGAVFVWGLIRLARKQVEVLIMAPKA